MYSSREQNVLNALKAQIPMYLPAWRNMINVEPSSFVAKIAKRPLKNGKVIASAKVGLSGGFGFGSEGEETPLSGPTLFEKFEMTPKDMFAEVEISYKATQLGGERGSMFPLLKTEIESAYETAKWNLGRSVFGNGEGILAYVASGATDSTNVVVDSLRCVKEGLIIDIYSGETLKTKAVRILKINRVQNTLILSRKVTVAEGDFITVQNSYKKELTGLGCIYDDSITSLYGVNKKENPAIVPTVVDGNGDISDIVIMEALRTSEREKNGKPDLILAGDAAYDSYVSFLRQNDIRVEETTHEITGGFKAIKFLHGNREVDIINERFVPDTEMWGVETGTFELQQTDWNFADLTGNGNYFQLLERRSAFRALLTNFADLTCSNPGGCFKIINATITG